MEGAKTNAPGSSAAGKSFDVTLFVPQRFTSSPARPTSTWADHQTPTGSTQMEVDL